MTETPPPHRAGRRKTLGFLIGGFILIAAVAAAYFADGGSAGQGFAPSTKAVAPVLHPVDPAAPSTTAAPAD
jgi:hypothetical protein